MSPRVLLILLCLFVLAPAARAADATVFVAWPKPGENWSRGFGATLSTTWFKVVALEGEAARIPAANPAVTMTTFTGSALLAPSVGFLTPYGGLGIGLFRQAAVEQSDTGVLRALVLGAKAKFGPLLVVKAEYRRLRLDGNPLLAVNDRYSVGAGISF